jgi:hypothetical protein
MLIQGAWSLADDGMLRPVIQGEVRRADGTWEEATFLVDCGADRTVLDAATLDRLGLTPVESAERLEGVSGRADSIVVETEIHLKRETGSWVLFKGRFAAFTRLEASDTCILGRDITNFFALIVDRPQDVVCLLGQGHRYAILPP